MRYWHSLKTNYNFGISKQAIRSEDGLSVIPDATLLIILDLDAYDEHDIAWVQMDIREAIETQKIIDFIKKFDGKTIGAISIAPLLLVRAGLLNGNRSWLVSIKKRFLKKDFPKVI